MSEEMGELDSVNMFKKKLMDSLGEKFTEYNKLMRKWFSMAINQEQLDKIVTAYLTPYQKHLHTQLLIHVAQRCRINSRNTDSHSRKANKRFRSCVKSRQGFEPIDPVYYVVTDRIPVRKQLPPFMITDRLLLDQSTMLARLMYGAWELGLEGSQPKAAEFLTIATKHFLKNILTAIISHRKGYKCSTNGFIHGIDCPIPNPWLHNVTRRKPELFHSLRFDGVLNNPIVIPGERPTREEIEQEEIFSLSSSSAVGDLGPITLYDLRFTLELCPTLISSNFVRITNTERLFASICHPAIDN